MALLKERHAGEVDIGKASAAGQGAAVADAREGRMTLSPAFLDELRLRTSLSSLIGRSVKLQQGRARVQGLLPVPQREDAELHRQ